MSCATTPLDRSAIALVVAALVVACGRDGRAVLHDDPPARAAAAPSAPPPTCVHAVCGDDFFVDTAAVGECVAGAPCALALTLVATGGYHINDAYPYRFRASVDGADAGVAFAGSGTEGHAVFSRTSNDWAKQSDTTGTMTVRFEPQQGEKRAVAIAGVFKLSVCSAENCRLESVDVSALVPLRRPPGKQTEETP
jgi:hypothetical protein